MLKKYLWVRSHELLPPKCWKLVFIASEWLGVFFKVYPEQLSRLSRGPVAGNHRRHFFDPTGLQSPTGSEKRFFDPIGDCNRIWPSWIEKVLKWFPATGPLEKLETALGRSWRKLRIILRRGRPIFNIFGAKAHSEALKGTFSTDC